MQTGRNKKRTARLLTVLFGIGLFVSLIWLAKYFWDLQRIQNRLKDIRDEYVQETEPTVEEEGTRKTLPVEQSEVPDDAMTEQELVRALLEQYQVSEKEIDFSALHAEQNADIYAWITIPDTNIDYPVLQHPTEQDYYLEYNMDGSKGRPGCIYSQLMNSKDFTDRVTILYGHNMRNGSMFASLHYFEDPIFFEEHPYVYVYTEEQILVYRIFAAYEYHNGHILLFNDVVSDEGFLRFIEDIYAGGGLHDQYNETAKPGTEDRVLILSTCIKNKPEKRWLVATVLQAAIPVRGNVDETQ